MQLIHFQFVLSSSTACKTAGMQFLAYLEKTIQKTKNETSSNRLSTLLTSMKICVDASKVVNFSTKLDRLREVLMLATTLALRMSTRDQHAELVSHLQALHITHKSEDDRTREVAATIEQLIDTIQNKATSWLSDVQEHVDRCLERINTLRDSLPLTTERTILDWLDYRQRSWRYEEVPPAYRKTFEWILEPPSCKEKWSNFGDHLLSQDRSLPYFIVGKAGSGKSTLMKFLLGYQKTRLALEQWAHPLKLVTISFFFWNLGTALQKSINGLLRSLLHGVLSQYPELIPAVLPSFYQNLAALGDSTDPSYTEMKAALDLLRDKSLNILKICVFIDGIDELQGDHKDLALFLRALASPHLKVVLSSRPINACINTFQGCPSLQLQDLTRSDMATFIEGELCAHPLMVHLSKCSPTTADTLVTEMKDKAEGVFLWVSLVVRLLVDGLENGDDVSDLLQKLRSLPSDLADLYRSMMNRMSPEYRGQAAEIFMLHMEWRDNTREKPFPAAVLAIALQQPSSATHNSLAPDDDGMLRWAVQSIEARIRSRCYGLLELHQRPVEREDSFLRTARFYGTTTDLAVEYLHRSVAEFLAQPDVWTQICSAVQKPNFDPAANLALACLAMMKATLNLWDPSLRVYLGLGVAFVKRAPTLTLDRLQQYMTQIDETMNQFHKGATFDRIGFHWSVHPEFGVIPEAFWSIGVSKPVGVSVSNHCNLLTFAVRTGFHEYLRLASARTLSDPEARSVLLIHAFESWIKSPASGPKSTAREIPGSEPNLADMAETLQCLLTHTIRPEESYLDLPITSIVLRLVTTLQKEEKWLEIAELLRVVLVTSKSPNDLMKQLGEEAIGVLRKIISSDDCEVRSIGTSIKRILATDDCKTSLFETDGAINEQEVAVVHSPIARQRLLDYSTSP